MGIYLVVQIKHDIHLGRKSIQVSYSHQMPIIKSVHRIETALVGFHFVLRYENAH
jgi:hypothetical protein